MNLLPCSELSYTCTVTAQIRHNSFWLKCKCGSSCVWRCADMLWSSVILLKGISSSAKRESCSSQVLRQCNCCGIISGCVVQGMVASNVICSHVQEVWRDRDRIGCKHAVHSWPLCHQAQDVENLEQNVKESVPARK